MTIREMYELADRLEDFSRGNRKSVDIETALRELETIQQVNVRENVYRFREGMKQRGLVSGITPEGMMLRAAQGVRDAVGNFVEPRSPVNDENTP